MPIDASPDAGSTAPAAPGRLPTTAIPRRYDLVLAPDLDAATFTGSARVELALSEATTQLVCNAAELTVDGAHVEIDGRQVAATVTLDETAETATFTLTEAIGPGTATLVTSFAGILNDKLRGFYRSTYTDDSGTPRTIAVTQFEATDARRAFPCWDEPAFKAVFGVTLEVADELLAISNGPEIGRDSLGDGRTRVRFADTMPMSTYLVAFVVGPLETSRTVDVDGVPLRIVFRPGQAELADFALEVGAFALRFYADYYGIGYPDAKVDMVAVPDFAFGAMENLGCVVYRETLLLVDPTTATQSELLAVVDVIAHELAHMWFGDLVTMAWWNGIWLNEAFATFMEMKCSDAFRPQWERWMTFGRERSAAFDVDALEATRPIEYPVHTPADAEGMFDVLTYQKGSAVVRMLEQYLGETNFRDGIRRYLDAHRHANTETSDLWDALEAETGEPVRAMMDSWIFQGGFPLVSADRDGTTLELTQRQFRYLGHGASDTTWHVPLVVRAGSTTTRLVLDQASAAVEVAPDGPVVVNAGGHAFYRVGYDDGLYAALLEHLAGIEPLERYAVLDDTLALTLQGTRSGADLAALVTTLVEIGETDLAVWQLAGSALEVLHRSVDPDDQAVVSRWICRALAPLAAGLGDAPDPGDDDRRRALRGLVLGLRGAHGDPSALARAREVFATVLSLEDDVDAELAAGSLRAVAVHATAADFDSILGRFRNGVTPQEQLRFLFAAAAVSDPALFRRYLDLLATDEVRSQNLAFAYRAALRNVDHAATAWAEVTQRWESISARLPFNSTARLFEGVTAFSDPALADDASAFLLAQDMPQAAQLIAQHLERMEVQVALRAREARRLPSALG